MPPTDAERAAAHRLRSAAAASPGWRPRTWHGARIIHGPESGIRGFIVGTCDDGCPADSVRLLQAGGRTLYRCVPLSWLAPFPTRHGGVPCPGDTCTEGDLLC